jgi:hypothetical protein
VANQQKNIATEIVAVTELLLEELILLGRERPWESLRGPWNVLATDQMCEVRTLFHASQFVEDGT